MSLERIIAATDRPAAVDSLVNDLRAVGVTAGSVLMVHSSLSSLGYVNGGAAAVIEALTRVLGPTGTLVMPTHSSDLSDPAAWRDPPVPPAWHLSLRESMLAFDPATTPTWRMGAIAEAFRTHPGVLRSGHPRQSCAARGRRAETITNAHALDCAMGDRSPMGRLYALDAWILLLGVGHDRNTSLHLAEYRAAFPGKHEADFGSPVNVYGKRRWRVVRDLDIDDSDFARLGDDFEHDTQQVIIGPVAQATARLMRMRALVDYAVAWMGRNRL